MIYYAGGILIVFSLLRPYTHSPLVTGSADTCEPRVGSGVNPRIGSGDEMSKRSEREGGGSLLGWGTREPLFCLVSFHSPPPIYTMWALLLYASIPASSGVIYLTEESEHTAAWVSPGCRRCCVLTSLSVIPVSLAVPG
ncbi:hypothetical protein B296_00051771 [Ensete ventricosum]|uniref:Uncharacterized protein n=1 Tax=Ensete ventricosum TaxID=4639 RepID=A0A426XJ73_ENSVE|nr:hypothetical protein B296_00051771 [Ensete ventricosum]